MYSTSMEKKKIFFWAESDEYGWMSNFWPGPYQIEGQEWPTTEHYFAAQKTLNLEQREMIRVKVHTPLGAKRYGRMMELRTDWEGIKYEVMKTALRAKFGIDPLKSKLLATDDSLIYEDSPFDKIWGTGERGGVGVGKNLLGKALMEVREELRTKGI